MKWDDWPRPSHGAHASAAQMAAQPAPFAVKTAAEPVESGFPDWRARLTRNLARRSDGRWEPLTWVHPPVADQRSIDINTSGPKTPEIRPVKSEKRAP